MLEGVDAEMEAEEIGHRDLSVGVVCKNYEEPGPRGSAAHFLLGVEMEGDPPGNENVEGGALTAVSAYCFTNINDSNKCQSSSPIDDDAVDVVSAAVAVDVESAAAAEGLPIVVMLRCHLTVTAPSHRGSSARFDENIRNVIIDVSLLCCRVATSRGGRIATTTINHWKGQRERRWQSKR